MNLQVSTSMKDLCFDAYGISKEKKDPRDIKGNRGMCLFNFVLQLSIIPLMVLLLLMYRLLLAVLFYKLAIFFCEQNC